MNNVVFRGNLTRDVELKYSSEGIAIGNSSIAVNRKYKTNSGQEASEVMFMDISFFGRLAEIAYQYLSRGSSVLLRGRIVYQQWVDKTTGADRTKHSLNVEQLEMLNTKKYNQNNQDDFQYYDDNAYNDCQDDFQYYNDCQENFQNNNQNIQNPSFNQQKNNANQKNQKAIHGEKTLKQHYQNRNNNQTNNRPNEF